MKKEFKFAHNAELQEPRKTVKKPGFSDFRSGAKRNGAKRSEVKRNGAERSEAKRSEAKRSEANL